MTEEKFNYLFSKGVGEIGLSPKDFCDMTEEELDLAYNGYLEKKEIEANLMVSALFKEKNNDTSLIRLLEEKKYNIGSIEERTNVFDTLGISEVEYGKSRKHSKED